MNNSIFSTVQPEPQANNYPIPIREFAVVDLGSNSFHLTVVREINGTLQIINRLKQQVQLASGLDSNYYLSNAVIEKGLACLSLFAERLQNFSFNNVRIIGTYTLRTAKNSALFLSRAKMILPYPIEIISGQEEARLIYLGAAHTLPEKERKIVIDIGGGSTEFALGEGFNVLITQSCPMGCVTFTQQFFATGKISRQAFQQAVLSAEQKIEHIAWQYQLLDWEYAFGASGTIKSIQAILLELGYNDGVITAKRLNKLIEKTLKYSHIDKIDFEGLLPSRKKIFVAGLAILSAIFNILTIKEMHISSGALREGIMYEMSNNLSYTDIQQRTAMALIEQYDIDKLHAQRVLESTQYLYAQWSQYYINIKDVRLQRTLFWSAILHEIGLSINYSGVHKHSAYILANTNLPGFNQEQQLLLACLVRFHRKTIKLDELPKFNLYKEQDILQLLKILRLSIILNGNRKNNTEINLVQLEITKNHVRLFFPNGFFKKNSLIKLELEQEQEYWQPIDNWKLSFYDSSIVPNDPIT